METCAIVLFIVILGVGVKTTAHVSMLFRDWMENVFQKCDVTEIVPDSKTVDMGDSKISLKNDVQMTGQNETFLYETSYDGIEEKVDYKAWLCGHWHIEKQIDKLRFLFHDVVSLEMIKRGFK